MQEIRSQASDDGTLLTIAVRGRFDFSVHQDFRRGYEAQLKPSTRVIVDLRQVDYLDSSALGMLLLLREHAGDDRSRVLLQVATPEVRNILEVSNFDRLFQIA